MSKEFEALKRLTLKNEYKTYDEFDNDYVIIEEALQRLEAIDNANPSGALECLDKLAKQIELDEDTDFWEIRNAHKIVEQALIKAQEQEKVLKIIKEKKVNIDLLYASSGVEQYNDELVRTYGMWFVKDRQLTKEEFDTLKRYLENE